MADRPRRLGDRRVARLRDRAPRRRAQAGGEAGRALARAQGRRPLTEVRALVPEDRAWVERTIRERWGSDVAVAHGVAFRPADLEGFVALEGELPVGLVTYTGEADDAIEIVTIDAFAPRRGVGRALVEAVRALGTERIHLITTNDNVSAQRFYEALGFRLVAVHEGAVERSRELKPEIPLLAEDGTPIRDELEYEWRTRG